MRYYLLTALGLVTCSSLGCSDAQAKPPLALEGTWNVVSVSDNGRSMAADKIKDARVVFAEDRVTFEIPQDPETEELNFVMDSGKIGNIDFVFKNRLMLGIYELQQDELKICYNEGGAPRSTEFASEPKSKNDVLLILKRAK